MDPAGHRGTHGYGSLQRHPWIQLVSELICKSFKNIPRGLNSQECEVGVERDDISGDSALPTQQVDNAMDHVSHMAGCGNLQLSSEAPAVGSSSGANTVDQITPQA